MCVLKFQSKNMVRVFALVRSIQNIKVDFLNSTKKRKIQRNRIINVFSIKINPFQKDLVKNEKIAENDIAVKYQSKIEQARKPYDEGMDQQFDFPLGYHFQDKIQYNQAKGKIFRQFTNKRLKNFDEDYQPVRVPSNHTTMVENQLKRAAKPLKKQLVQSKINLGQNVNKKIHASKSKQKKKQKQMFDSDEELSATSSRARMYKQHQTEQKQSRQLQMKIVQHVLKHGVDNAEIQEKFGMKGYREAFYLLKRINRRGILMLTNMAVSMKLRHASYPKKHIIDKVGSSCLSKIGSKQSNDDQKIVRLRNIILRLILTLGKRSKQTVKKQQIAEGVQLLDELQQFVKKSLKMK